MDTIIKCKCGSEDFWLNESLGWKCFVGDDGALECHNKANDISSIVCKQCDAVYSEENFSEINFN